VLLGAVVSTVKVLVAGAVALPAASTMRTSKVWDASVRPVYACGLVQAAYVPLSIRHWYVSPAPAPAKTKLADVTLIALAGPVLIVGVEVGADTSMVIVAEASVAVAGTVLPAASAPAPAAMRSPSVVSAGEAFVSVTVYGPAPDPATDATVQPVAVRTVKSLVVIPVTEPLNATSNVAVPLLLGDDVVGTKLVNVGAVRSTTIVEATESAAGPAFVAASTIALAVSVRMTVPSVGAEAVTGIVYGPAPEPVGVPIVQPVEVPPSARSEAVRPVTDSLNVTLYDRLVAFVGEAVVGAKALMVGRVRSTSTLELAA